LAESAVHSPFHSIKSIGHGESILPSLKALLDEVEHLAESAVHSPFHGIKSRGHGQLILPGNPSVYSAK